MSLKKAVRNYGGSYEKVIPEEQSSLEKALSSTFAGKLVKLVDGAWEYGLTFGVARADAKEIFKKLKSEERFSFEMLIDVTAVDWLDRREPRFDVVYQLMSLTKKHRLTLKVQVNEDQPEVDSVVDLWKAADFLEREVWDMYGIKFAGHPDLRRVLMYEEFVGHPLRKDYPINGKQPRIPLRIPELRNTSQDMYKEQLVSLPTRSTKTCGK